MYYVTAECPHFSQSRGLGLMYYVRAEYPPLFPTNTFIEKNPDKIEILKNSGFIAPLNY